MKNWYMQLDEYVENYAEWEKKLIFEGYTILFNLYNILDWQNFRNGEQIITFQGLRKHWE